VCKESSRPAEKGDLRALRGCAHERWLVAGANLQSAASTFIVIIHVDPAQICLQLDLRLRGSMQLTLPEIAWGQLLAPVSIYRQWVVNFRDGSGQAMHPLCLALACFQEERVAAWEPPQRKAASYS
jgi:hypothetical protein